MLLACGGSDESEEAPPLDLANVPVPPADGPKLLATRHDVVVRERPTPGAASLGTLRLGAMVARSEAALTTEGCPGGWFAVRPKGFVCGGEEATVDLDRPAATVAPPALGEPLPCRYGRVKHGGTITYGPVPTAEEQAAAEPKKAKPVADRRLGAGANDVPLDENFRPTG